MGKVASTISKGVGMIPGVGTVTGAAIGGLGGLLSGGGLKGMATGALGGMGPLGQVAAAGLGGLLASKSNAFKPQITSTQNAASPMAGNYANFLNSMMGGQGGAQDAIQNMLAGRPGDPSNLQQYFGAGMGGNGQADLSGVNPAIQPINVGYTPQDVQSQFSPEQISGQYNVQNVASGFNPTQFAANFSPEQVAAMQVQGGFNAPEFASAQFNQLDPISAQQIGFNAPQFQTAQLNSLNLQNLGREALATGPNMMQGFGERGNFGSIVNPAANADAMQQIMGRQDQRNIADLRERFGNQALSTGAMGAESLYRAEAAPRAAIAIDEITRQNQAQQLQQRGQDIGAWQAGRGFDVQQLGMGGDQANALNQALIAQRGQDVSQLGLQSQTGLGLNDQQLRAAQMANQFGIDLGQLGLQAGQANQSANLQAAGLNQQGAMNMNQLIAQLTGQQNQFNQQNAQFGAQNDLQAQLANQDAMLRAAGINTQQNQFGAQLGLNAQQMQDASNQFGAGQDLQAQLANIQNQQFGANFGQNAAQLNNQFGQNAAAQALQAAMANQSNQQIASQQGIQAGGMNNDMQMQLAQLMQSGLLNNQQMGNQWNLGLQNIGLGQQQNQAQAQQAALAQLFGGFNNMGQLGMPQAENVVNPSAGQNFAGGVGAVGSLLNIFNQAKAMGQPNGGNIQGVRAPALPSSNQFLPMQIPQINQALNLPAYFGGR
jgi:hypothetical protein